MYRAQDQETGAHVAVKVLRGSATNDVQRFEREAKLLQKLTHPRIVRYVAAGVTHDGHRYIIEEWVDGVSLREHMARIGLSPAEAVLVVRNLADALVEAHHQGVVHRDVKPDNIILENGDLSKLRLLDFGIAREMFESIPLTRTGTMVGTPSYMAPEQARGRPNIDERADVFSLGCLLYECLTGRRPFPGPTLVAVRTKVIMCEPTPVRRLCPDAPPRLVRLVAEMLAKDPNERPRNASAIVAALDAIDELPEAPRRRTVLRDPMTGAKTGRFLQKQSDTARDDDQLTCVIMAASTADEDGMSTTRVVDDIDPNVMDHLCTALEPLGAKLEILEGGALVLTLASRGDARECASRAARAALAVKEYLPGKSVAISSYKGCKPAAAGKDKNGEKSRKGDASASNGNGGDGNAVPESSPEASLERAIDWVAQAVEAAELDAIFADFQANSDGEATINVDNLVARLLPPEMVEKQANDTWLLAGGDDKQTLTESV